MDDPQGMSALGEKKRNWVVARKREAVVAEREGERRGHSLSLWNMCMDNSGGLWLQDSCVLPTLTVSSGRAFAEKLAGPLGMGATQAPISCSKCVWKLL